jgi:hypothetical protein
MVMVLESNMGTNNKCVVKQGKSALMGCMWYPDCAKDCSCSGDAVWSDEGQISHALLPLTRMHTMRKKLGKRWDMEHILSATPTVRI